MLLTLFASIAPAHAGTPLDHGHADGFWVAINNGNLQLLLNDHTTGLGIVDPSTVDLIAKPASQGVISNPPAQACLGSAGQDVWILPQSVADLQNGLLWLGWSAEALDNDDVVNDRVTVTLTAVSGPAGGVFCGYTLGFGGQKYFDTSNGLSSADAAVIPVDQHLHINWAFTECGEWTLTFQLSGTPEGGSLQTVTEQYHFLVDTTTC